MSKTVVIPSTQGNPWTCSVNNHKYAYEAGSTQEVPDEVASIIDSADDFPKPAPEVQPPFPTGGGGGGDMVVNGGFDDSYNIVLDKTFTEIVDAAPSVIIALTVPEYGVEYFRPDFISIDDGVAMFDNYQLEADGDGGFSAMFVKQLYLYESGDIQLAEGSISIS